MGSAPAKQLSLTLECKWKTDFRQAITDPPWTPLIIYYINILYFKDKNLQTPEYNVVRSHNFLDSMLLFRKAFKTLKYKPSMNMYDIFF